MSAPLVAVITQRVVAEVYLLASGQYAEYSASMIRRSGLFAITILCLCAIVLCQNRAPVAQQIDVVTFEDTSVAVQLNATDPDGQAVTYAIVSGPSRGIVSSFLTAVGSFTYTPLKDFFGTDVIVYSATDGSLPGQSIVSRSCIFELLILILVGKYHGNCCQ